MANGYNEGKALDAVLRFIEARDNALRKDDGRSPDDLNDPDEQRRVDYVCTIGQTLYAFEHTRIEPFPNQITWADHNWKLFDPIIARFDHRSDRELWYLIVPVDASAGLTVNNVGQVQDALIKWIETNAARVPVVPHHNQRADLPLTESADGVPFRFSLRRASLYMSYSRLSGGFMCMTLPPADLEQQRADRLKTTCERKSPKLAKWKRDAGARTILVLEANDMSLTSHLLVADALAPAEATMPDAPDEVFMVSTGLDQTWWVVCLRGLGRVDGKPMPHREFNPKELTKLTSR
jgi:hypothetical protein